MSERKIVDYIILGSSFSKDLELEISKYIRNGYILQGGLSSKGHNLYQAMVKYEDER